MELECWISGALTPVSLDPTAPDRLQVLRSYSAFIVFYLLLDCLWDDRHPSSHVPPLPLWHSHTPSRPLKAGHWSQTHARSTVICSLAKGKLSFGSRTCKARRIFYYCKDLNGCVPAIVMESVLHSVWDRGGSIRGSAASAHYGYLSENSRSTSASSASTNQRTFPALLWNKLPERAAGPVMTLVLILKSCVSRNLREKTSDLSSIKM